MASVSSAARRAAPLLDPAHQQGLTSLLSRTYNKPVKLNLVPLKHPHQDADILAQYVVQKLRDRRNGPRRVIRDAAWKADLPTALAITRKQQAQQARAVEEARSPLSLQKMTLGGVTEGRVGDVIKSLSLSQVSSVRVSAAGRLSRRITANRADSKMAIRGASRKAPTHYLQGAVKANTAHALREGKRRIGSYGVRISLGYS